jgi:hypothetical protein
MKQGNLSKFILANREKIESFHVCFNVLFAVFAGVCAYGTYQRSSEVGILWAFLSFNMLLTAFSEHQSNFIKRLQRKTIDTMRECTDEVIKNYDDFVLSADEKNPNMVVIMKNQIKELRMKRADALKEIDKKL